MMNRCAERAKGERRGCLRAFVRSCGAGALVGSALAIGYLISEVAR